MFNTNEIKIAIIGLGYVGRLLAFEFGKKYAVIGFDINKVLLTELIKGHDSTLEVDDAELSSAKKLSFSSQLDDLCRANV